MTLRVSIISIPHVFMARNCCEKLQNNIYNSQSGRNLLGFGTNLLRTSCSWLHAVTGVSYSQIFFVKKNLFKKFVKTSFHLN